ncbi:MAG: ATP-dependent protease, partial [Candidatus Dormiibacterota bacterium]
TGDQGVLIPAANQANLMLSANVVEAVARHAFHVWTVSTVDEGLELLTGVASGDRVDGEFAVGTLHRAVEDRLRSYAEALRAFGSPRDGQGSSPPA